MTRRRRTIVVVWMVAAAAAAAGVAGATGPDGWRAKVEWIDGTERECVVRSFDSGSAQLECEGDVSASWDELASLTFRAARIPAAGEPWTYLRDGGRISTIAHRTDIQSEGQPLSQVLLEQLSDIPVEQLAGSWYGAGEHEAEGRRQFDALMAERPAGRDTLLVRRADGVHSVTGRLDRMEGEGGTIVIGDETLEFTFRTLAGIVLARGIRQPREWPLMVGLMDGGELPASPISGDGEELMLNTALGESRRFATSDVAWIKCRSTRVVPLSAMTPASNETTGVLNEPIPARMDRGVGNLPMSMEGRSYERGIGVHARNRMSYRLNGGYEKFASAIGIDDAVRPRGSVVFRVEGDGRTLFDSGTVTGRDAVRTITVDVSGVVVLTLAVDEADGLELSDHANWAEARVIRPRGGG